jgi:hypothetical protein
LAVVAHIHGVPEFGAGSVDLAHPSLHLGTSGTDTAGFTDEHPGEDPVMIVE